MHRPALVVLVVVVAVAALALGWWQWERFSSASGTAQNLGYAMQWPLFAGFALFAYFRFVRLEQESGQPAGEAPDTGADPGQPGDPAAGPAAEAPGARREARFGRRARAADGPREIPAGFLPERPRAAREDDPALAEYNTYLARLHAEDGGAGGTAGAARNTERSAG